MMSLKCQDMGMDCHFVAHGQTKDEVKKEMMDHAQMAHPEVLGGSEEDMKAMEQKMDEMIK
ncbi:DUF1059 domain-containing protein [Candidatus Falkowbacteria bacterium]|nr:DUF1059 domain-containing protein [Candidatus Falkowbacteria bacterium]